MTAIALALVLGTSLLPPGEAPVRASRVNVAWDGSSYLLTYESGLPSYDFIARISPLAERIAPPVAHFSSPASYRTGLASDGAGGHLVAFAGGARTGA